MGEFGEVPDRGFQPPGPPSSWDGEPRVQRFQSHDGFYTVVVTPEREQHIGRVLEGGGLRVLCGLRVRYVYRVDLLAQTHPDRAAQYCLWDVPCEGCIRLWLASWSADAPREG